MELQRNRFSTLDSCVVSLFTRGAGHLTTSAEAERLVFSFLKQPETV